MPWQTPVSMPKLAFLTMGIFHELWEVRVFRGLLIAFRRSTLWRIGAMVLIRGLSAM